MDQELLEQLVGYGLEAFLAEQTLAFLEVQVAHVVNLVRIVLGCERQQAHECQEK